MAGTAIAYVADVILGRTGEVIGREAQKEEIRRHAAENGIEIVGWFEDEAYNEDIATRDGIRALLACDQRSETLLVERVWSLSRDWQILEAFLRDLALRGMNVEAASTLWDCTSQRARHFYSDRRKPKALRLPAREVVAAAAAVHIARPERFFFSNLIHRPAAS
jgi:DNA invertase Pin-like site-specific DNA recombinase